MALADFFTATLTIKEKANSRAANAGFARSDVTKATCVPCRIMDNASGQAYIAGSRAAINAHDIITEYSDIDNGDVVVITTEQDSSVTCRVDTTNWRRAIGGIGDFYVLSVVEIEN